MFPHDRRLIGALEIYVSAEGKRGTIRLQDRLGATLADWAKRRNFEGIARLSPSGFYAVVLAPVICLTMPATGPVPLPTASDDNWLDVLTAAALAGITPRKAGDRHGSGSRPADKRPGAKRARARSGVED